MINNRADEVTEELFQLLIYRYQIGLETSIRCSDFIYNFVNLLYHKCHKMNFKRYESLKKDDWKKSEKNNVTITLNALFSKKEKIYPAYVSRHYSNR